MKKDIFLSVRNRCFCRKQWS